MEMSLWRTASQLFQRFETQVWRRLTQISRRRKSRNFSYMRPRGLCSKPAAHDGRGQFVEEHCRVCRAFSCHANAEDAGTFRRPNGTSISQERSNILWMGNCAGR